MAENMETFTKAAKRKRMSKLSVCTHIRTLELACNRSLAPGAWRAGARVPKGQEPGHRGPGTKGAGAWARELGHQRGRSLGTKGTEPWAPKGQQH